MPDRIKAPTIKSPDEFEISLLPYQQFDLQNGAPVYCVPGGAEEVIKIEWVFSAGNYYEEKTGTAAAVNYLIRTGTAKKSAFDISNHFEFYGAFLSVACHNEYAVITLESLSKYMRELLPVVAELLTDAVFPEKEIQIYSQNSIQHLKVNLEKCDFVADRQISELLYGPSHPYGRKVYTADYQSLTRADIKNFYHRFYVNGKFKVFASGSLPADFENIMNEYFGGLKYNSTIKTDQRPRQVSEKKKLRHDLNKNGVQSAIRIARPFPDRKHPDFKTAMVLNGLLGGYFGSRLMSNIREKKGYTYGIYSYLQNHIQFGSWIISTETGIAVTEPAIKEIYKELEILCQKPAEESELKLLRNYMIGQQLASLDGPFQIMDRWKGIILNDLSEDYFNGIIQAIKTVTPTELQEVAHKYFDPKEFIQLTVV